jgi:intracellular sulfur oxidation DsrE/DsrF family protein
LPSDQYSTSGRADICSTAHPGLHARTKNSTHGEENQMSFVRRLALTMIMVFAAAASGNAASKTAKVAFHVNDNNPATMNLALNNVQNVVAYYKQKKQPVEIEVVAYGPGLHMFREDSSPVKDRISSMSLENKNVHFAACGNTKAGMEKKEGKPVTLMSEAKVVPSGVIRLMELQEKGYAYIKP